MVEAVHDNAGPGPLSREGEWVVTLDIEDPAYADFHGELAVRALSAVVGGRTYVAARTAGYSFTVILGTAGAEPALSRAMALLAIAQRQAGLAEAMVVCAEVTLVGTRPQPAATGRQGNCENPAP